MSSVPHVYQAINEVTAAMASEGLGKTRKNDQQNYKFRGIDDVYNVLARHLANAKLCILPRVIERAVSERPTKSGGLSTYTVLTVDFDFVSAVDGSKHTIRTMGEAMDTADKSTNKAMSAAMKYACLLAFQIPTEGDNDADASHHEPAASKPGPAKAPPPPAEAKSNGKALPPIPDTGVNVTKLLNDLVEAKDTKDLSEASLAVGRVRDKLTANDRKLLGAAHDNKVRELETAAAPF